MNSVEILTPLVQKRTEGVQKYFFLCYQDKQQVYPDDKYVYVASFANDTSLVKKVNCKINGSMLEFDSDQLEDLAAGVYRLELWETIKDTLHAIYPSDRYMTFTVLENTQDLPQGTVSTLTLDEFERRFKMLQGSVGHPRFKIGEVLSVPATETPTVEMITQPDGTVIVNYKIPQGRTGDTWKPYIADDGHWHIKLQTHEEIVGGMNKNA